MGPIGTLHESRDITRTVSAQEEKSQIYSSCAETERGVIHSKHGDGEGGWVVLQPGTP